MGDRLDRVWTLPKAMDKDRTEAGDEDENGNGNEDGYESATLDSDKACGRLRLDKLLTR